MPELVVRAADKNVDATRGPRHSTGGSGEDAAERRPAGPGPVVIGLLHQALVRAAGKAIEVIRAPGGPPLTRCQAAGELFPGEPRGKIERIDPRPRRYVEPSAVRRRAGEVIGPAK